MPIPGTDVETTAEVAARMIREERAENQRLRDLLMIARIGLEQAGVALEFAGDSVAAGAAQFAFARSTP